MGCQRYRHEEDTVTHLTDAGEVGGMCPSAKNVGVSLTNDPNSATCPACLEERRRRSEQP